jgi:hypothetical protein
MPVGVADTQRLIQLRNNEGEPLLGHPDDVHLDVKNVSATHLRHDPAGHYVQILESLEDASERAQISLSGDPQA